MTEASSTSWLLWQTCLLLLSFSTVTIGVELDSLVDQDLTYEERPQTTVFHPRLGTLWSAALDSPEMELKRQASQAISEAHQAGMNNLEDMIPKLMELLRTDDLPEDVTYDVAHALIELEAFDAAELLMKRAEESNLSLSLLIEPALARWDFKPMRKVWLARIDQDNLDSSRIVLAIDGLRVVKESQAVESLRSRVRDRDDLSEIRLKSALALGAIQHEGLESIAHELMTSLSAAAKVRPEADSSFAIDLVNRLVSARLLRYHDGDEAVELLVELAADLEGAVAVIALERLLEIDPSLVKPINKELVGSPDANVRRLVSQALTGQATVEAVVLLNELLDDPIPDIRVQTADQMVLLDGNEGLSDIVRTSAMKMLMSDRPRGVEQAAMVLGAIDHKPAADTLVKLLYSDVHEVAVAAAWGLRKLVVIETAEPILNRLRSEVKRTKDLDDELWKTWKSNPPPTVDFKRLSVIYRQLDQLIQTLGLLEYVPSREVLEQFLPTPPARGLGDPPAVAATYTVTTRSAAIWTLGHLPIDDSTDRISGRLSEILNATPPVSPTESSQTRAAAAMSLGWMNIRSAIPLLKKYRDSSSLAAHERVGAACGRTLHNLVGDPLPKSVPNEVHRLGWFLEPID